MFNRKILCSLFFLFAVKGFSQKNLQSNPEKPKAGEVITFTYEPAGDLKTVTTPIEAVAYITHPSGEVAQEIKLAKEGKKYSGKIHTDTSQYFLYIVFSSGDRADYNFGEGYLIPLYDRDKLKKGANWAMSLLYGMYNGAGVEHNNDKAKYHMEQELLLYPETKKEHIMDYLRHIYYFDQKAGLALAHKEIEGLIKAGLKTEEDYDHVAALYTHVKLPEQAALIGSIKKEKFPKGKWTITEATSKFYAEKDPAKKEQLLADLVKKAESDPAWKSVLENLSGYKTSIANAYAQKNDWEGFKRTLAASGIATDNLLTHYNYSALTIVRKNDSANLKYAEEFARFAAGEAKKEWLKPTGKKPARYSTKTWDKVRAGLYARNADVYAQVLYKMGQYKKGLAFAKDAAIAINKGKSASSNKTYAILAEKALPEKQYKKELEQFVIDAKTTPEINEILKRLYVKQKGSDAGFDEYWASLQNANYNKFLAELSKSKLNTAAPSFALYDLNGKKVGLEELKGKVVVLDFWATWCAPCIASFPAMQKVIDKYKTDPDVKFLFVDTWEKGDNKKKKVSDFVSTKKLSFHVLLDDENTVVADYKVTGIPTKFVIDKNGVIRFRSEDFKENEDEKLMNELSAMIEIARGEKSVVMVD